MAICTHFLPAEIPVYLRKRKLLDIPIGVVVTDFDAHAMWLYRGVDWYFVAYEETKVHLAVLGIPPETIHVTGIPIDPVFAEAKPKRETRETMGLDPDLTTILVSAGGFGMGPVESLVRALHEIRHPIQLVVICGKNGALERRLKGFHGGCASHARGRLHDRDGLVDGRRGPLGGEGGLSHQLRGAGQEERNSDHFLEEGAAIRCNNLPALAFKVERLLEDTERLARMRQAIARLARPQAAADLVSLVTNARPLQPHQES